MTSPSDILIGRLAVERGLVSTAQLAECLTEQGSANGSPLGAILVRRGLLRPQDLEALLEEQRKRASDGPEPLDPRLEDALLARFLIRQGRLTEAQMVEALRAQAEALERGEKASRLQDLLVGRGILEPEAAGGALLLHRRSVLTCPSCGARFSTAGTEPSRKYPCRACGCLLERHEQTILAAGGQTTGAVRIDVPDDVAEASKDPSRRFADGRYVLVREVGRGGMGIVWKAWQTDLRRYAAIKILVGTMWTDVELKRFYREAQMAASLSHTNIASIYEVGSFEGKHFIAMEFVDGESLAQLMSPPTSKGTARAVRHLPPKRAIEIVRQAALAVDYAHSRRIIHRDLKPHNIMVQRADGRVYVMDFGLAKPIRPKEAVTVSDAIVGTPQYMSPEQARGDALDRRSDVYSLGAVLYHVLAGRPPFEARSPAETMMAVLADDPLPPRRLNPRLHADLETICLKALDKDRHRRYDSARSFADDLTRYLEGEPISARPLSARERLWKGMRRHPVLSVLAGAAAAAGLLVLFVLAAVSWQSQAKIDELRDNADRAYAAGRYEEAKTFWEKVLLLDPGHPVAHQLIELCEGKIREKAARERRLQQIEQEEIESIRGRADAFFRAGQFEKAVLEYERLSTLDPLDEHAQRRRTRCLEEMARQREIQDELRKEAELTKEALLELTARVQSAFNARAKAMTHYERARQAVEIALQMKLEGEGAYTILEVHEKYRDARQAITRAIREDPSYAEAVYFRGTIFHKMGRYEEAERDFQEAVRLNRDFSPAWFGSAMTQLALYMLHAHTPYERDLKARDEALLRMNVAAEEAARRSAEPFERWCSIALQKFFRARSDRAFYADAADDVRKASVEGRGRYFYHFLLACILLEKGDAVEARQELTTALDLLPTALEALFLRAVTRFRREDLAGALQDARKAVESAPEYNYQVYLLRASVHEAMSEREPALRDLQQAAGMPGSPGQRLQRKIAELRRRT